MVLGNTISSYFFLSFLAFYLFFYPNFSSVNHAGIHMQGTEGENYTKGEMVKPRAPILVWSLLLVCLWAVASCGDTN